MDFLVRVFSAAFSGHDFSVLVFSVALFLVSMTVVVLALTAIAQATEKERIPRWVGVLMVSLTFTAAFLGWIVYVS